MTIVEYVGPKITPLVLFAAMAPPVPANFTWSNPEPRPKVPHLRELTGDQQRELDSDEDLSPEVAAWCVRREAAEVADTEWQKRDQYGRQVAWRWFYASLMVHAIPAPELAPQPLTTSPLIHGAFEAFAIERARQMHEKGYWPEHDDTHTAGELAAAAAWFAIPRETAGEAEPDAAAAYAALWPKDWTVPELAMEPTTAQRKRELEKAGALLAAEWERLDRLEKAR